MRIQDLAVGFAINNEASSRKERVRSVACRISGGGEEPRQDAVRFEGTKRRRRHRRDVERQVSILKCPIHSEFHVTQMLGH